MCPYVPKNTGIVLIGNGKRRVASRLIQDGEYYFFSGQVSLTFKSRCL